MAITLNHRMMQPIIHNRRVKPLPRIEEGGLFHDVTACSGNRQGGGTAAFVIVRQQLVGMGLDATILGALIFAPGSAILLPGALRRDNPAPFRVRL